MQRQYSFNFSSLFGLIILIVFAYFAFQIIKTLYVILLYLAPILLIIVFILRRQLLVNYFKKLFQNIKAQPLSGTLSAIVSLLMLPFSLLGMLFRAVLTNKIEKMDPESPLQSKSIEKEYVDYVDLSQDIDIDPSSKKSMEDWNPEQWINKHK